MAYTVHDTPAIVARIDRDLAHVVATVRSGDPSLRSLVLTGGFARGEGAVVDGQPQNDYDFVAVRGWRPPRVAYAAMKEGLEDELGLHIDLATAAPWRLGHVAASIFWYETALRGRVLWGPDVLAGIPIRRWQDLEPAEGLRLLVNRAAGLLLATPSPDAHFVRGQAAKALLAALDAHLLAHGEFAPSQGERWSAYKAARFAGTLPAGLDAASDSFAWAFDFKVRPEGALERDAKEAWATARHAILAAVPVALRHAGHGSLEEYAHCDRWEDRLVWQSRARHVAGARRAQWNPTGAVRAATLRLLEASPDGRVDAGAARSLLAPLARCGAEDPLQTLASLRAATLQ